MSGAVLADIMDSPMQSAVQVSLSRLLSSIMALIINSEEPNLVRSAGEVTHSEGVRANHDDPFDGIMVAGDQWRTSDGSESTDVGPELSKSMVKSD